MEQNLVEPSLHLSNVSKEMNSNFEMSKTMRRFIFSLMAITNLIINMDHGTIPAATIEIKKSFGITKFQLGILGSLVYLGTLIGSLIIFSLINLVKRKYLILGSLMFIIGCLIAFALALNIYLLFFVRMMTGVFQIFMSIYFPVWCFQFGRNQRRGSMIAILQVGVPLGVVFGYLLTAIIMGYLPWYFSIYIQAALTLILLIIFCFIPNIYFNRHTNNGNMDQSFSRSSENGLQENDQINKGKSKKNQKILQDLKEILKNLVFLFSALGLSMLYFIITSIQFWGTDYMLKVLNFTKNDAHLSFMITCVSAPTIGLFFGGFISAKIKNPDSKKNIISCVIISVLASISAVPVPFCNSIWTFTTFLWLLLFFGGAIVPLLTSVIISSLQKRLRPRGNSVSNFLQNLFGYTPGPFVYSLVATYSSNKSRLPIMVVLYSSVLGIICFVLAMIFKLRIDKIKKFEKKCNSVKQEASKNINSNNETQNLNIDTTTTKNNFTDFDDELKANSMSLHI